MSGFDLDLRSVEDQLPGEDASDADSGEDATRVVLGILDGTTPPETWYDHVAAGDVLVLNVEGDVNERAAGFARDVKDEGGNLMQFRGFLVVTPPGVDIDTDLLR